MDSKNRLALTAITLAGLCLATVPAHAREDKKPGRLLIGPQVGFYTPNGALARSRFGGTWTNIGLGFGDVGAPKESGQLNLDVNVMSSRASQAEVLLAPIGLVYRRSVSEERRVRPYVGASVNLLVANLRSDFPTDQIKSGWRTGTGGSVFGGVSVGNRFYVEGRYYGFSKIRGFDFSGTNIAIGWRL